VPPRVEFLWWDECPSWERALEDLRRAMRRAGLDPEAVELRRIETEQDAAREGFPGSPTIRVEGEDVEPPGNAEPTGLVCRVYRRPDGRASPLPDPDHVSAALERAAPGSG
jgi:hypothetical protein